MRWSTLGNWLSTHTMAVLGAVLVITVALVPGILRLEFATGQDSFLNSDSQIAADNELYQDLFGGETMVVLLTADEGKTIADFFTESYLDKLTEIIEGLEQEDVVQGVVSPVTAMTWTENLVTSGVASRVLADAAEREPNEEAKAIRAEQDIITTLRAVGAGDQDFFNPEWAKFLLFSNEGHSLDADGAVVAPPDADLVIRRSLRGFVPNTQNALMAVVLTGNVDLAALSEGEDLVKEALDGVDFDNVSVTITGTPTFLSDINDYLKGGMLTLGGIALVLMALVLLVVFRVRWRLLPLGVVLIGVTWAFGLLGYIGLDLSLVTISGLPILIGMGIDFAIQVHNRLDEEIVVSTAEAEADSPRAEDAFAVTARQLAPALSIATIAAAVSFISMQISQVPMIRDFGVLLALGIIVLFVIGVIMPLAVLGARERISTTSGSTEFGWMANGVVWLGSMPRALVYPLILLAVVVPIVGVSLESSFEIESDPINWANPETETIRNARFFEAETGFATTLGIFITTDDTGEYAEANPENRVFTDDLAQFVHDFTLQEVEDNPELAEASSLVTTLSYLIAIPGTTPLAPTGADMLAAYEVAPEAIQQLLIADNGNAAQINMRIAPSSLEERSAVFDDLNVVIASPPDDRAALPDNAAATPAGLATVGVGLLDNITSNRAALTYLALALVALWLVVRFRSATMMILSLVPVLIAVGLTSIIVALLDITLSPLTTVSGPLVIATCAEFTVLLLCRYTEERERGHATRRAADVAAIYTGRAFVASALTTVAGFGVLMFSALPLLSDFGAIVTLNVVVALLTALIVLPPVMTWADEQGLLDLTPEGKPSTEGRRRSVAVATVVALGLATGAIVLIVTATADDDVALAAVDGPAPQAVATVPPPTTAPPPATVDPDSEFLPPGPPSRPADGLVAQGVYDAYTDAGADPGQARCTADYLVNDLSSETEMIELGIATREPAATDLVAEAAEACGIPQDVRDAVAAD